MMRLFSRLPPAASRLLPHIGAAILFVALSVAFTWPLALNIGRAVSDPGDPFINIWILDWDWWATLHQPLELFHANAFHPAKYSLAFSENLYGLAILLFPLRLFGAGPITAYNVGMLAGFAFCGFATYLLGRRLTGCFSAGLAAGIFYAFVPFRFVHLPHIQHVWGGWLPLMLFALLLYAERPSGKRAAFFAFVFVMNGLTNIHYLLFGAFACGVSALLLIPRRDWRNLALASGAALLVLAPFLYPYAAVVKLYGMRSYGETLRYSAYAADWIFNPAEPERRLFPGFVALVCASVALFCRQRAKVALGLLWIAIGFLGSLGLHFELHRFLYGAVPGFRAVRVPARWAVIAYIGAAILIALVTAMLARKQRWLAFVVPLALLVELHPGRIRWWLAIPEAPPVYRWLASEGREPIAELPIVDTAEYFYLLRATEHHRPMINGISGMAPPMKLDLAAKAAVLSDDFLDSLKAAGVKLIVVHTESVGDRSDETRAWLQRELDRGRLSLVRRFERDWVFEIGGAPAGPAPANALAGWETHGTQFTTGGIHLPSGTTMRGSGFFSAWAKSPHGIRGVEFVFENGRVRHRASSENNGFVLRLGPRPANIRRDTDFQVEITDGTGAVTRLESRWLRWD